ncbi:hypothetical protein [Streptomyces cucumeris]|uniref:hypothetical protein n=1 Tax=Streptomyces cucumeris TaxID=2962890 RepID=UPI003D758806
MTDQPGTEHTDCTDCTALPGPNNTRIMSVKAGGRVSEVWHTPDCPALTVLQINWEEGAKRVHEQDAWAKGIFPAAHERLKQAAAAVAPDAAAKPFVDALTELVQAQADTRGHVVLHQWAEILERRFPPELPDPNHTTE